MLGVTRELEREARPKGLVQTADGSFLANVKETRRTRDSCASPQSRIYGNCIVQGLPVRVAELEACAARVRLDGNQQGRRMQSAPAAYQVIRKRALDASSARLSLSLSLARLDSRPHLEELSRVWSFPKDVFYVRPYIPREKRASARDGLGDEIRSASVGYGTGAQISQSLGVDAAQVMGDDVSLARSPREGFETHAQLAGEHALPSCLLFAPWVRGKASKDLGTFLWL